MAEEAALLPGDLMNLDRRARRKYPQEQHRGSGDRFHPRTGDRLECFGQFLWGPTRDTGVSRGPGTGQAA